MNAANRALWIVIGLLLLGVGVAGALASLNLLPGINPDASVLPMSLNARWRDWGFWAPAASIAIGLAIVGLGVLLLWAQLRRRGGRAMPDMDVPDGRGHTRIASQTLVRALSTDLSRDRDIADARVRLTGTRDDPRLLLRLLVTPGADLRRLRGFVDSSLTRFTATAGLDPQVADVEVRMSGGSVSRVA
jgi:hypothetical protein